MNLHLSICFPVSGSMISADPRIEMHFVEFEYSATSKEVIFSAFLYEAKLSFRSQRYSTTSALSFLAASNTWHFSADLSFLLSPTGTKTLSFRTCAYRTFSSLSINFPNNFQFFSASNFLSLDSVRFLLSIRFYPRQR